MSEAHCAIHASPNSPVAANSHAPSGNILRHVAVKQWEVRPDGAMRFAYCALRGLITINSTAEYAILGAGHYARHEPVVMTVPRAAHVATEKRDERVFKKSRRLSGRGDQPDDPDRTVFGAIPGARGSDPRPQTAGPIAAFGWIPHSCSAWRDILGSSRYRPLQAAQSQPKGQGAGESIWRRNPSGRHPCR